MLRNLYILDAVFAEHEAEPPLLVDADAVLSLAISRERLERHRSCRNGCVLDGLYAQPHTHRLEDSDERFHLGISLR